jgi:hypothetical protein
MDNLRLIDILFLGFWIFGLFYFGIDGLKGIFTRKMSIYRGEVFGFREIKGKYAFIMGIFYFICFLGLLLVSISGAAKFFRH